MARPRSSTETVAQVTENPGPSDGEPGTEGGGSTAPQATAGPAKTPPALPVEKTGGVASPATGMVVLYGPEGIGKSTLASQWNDGNIFFFNTANELSGLSVYQQEITSWAMFREYAWALKENPGQFEGAAIDTVDILGRYCAEVIRTRFKIAHESDAEYGKGWSALRDEWQINMARLTALPGATLLVTHETDVKMKTRTGEWDKKTIRGVKAIRETVLEMADFVLWISPGDEEETRAIHTKPSRYWSAKERGETPRLPEKIIWEHGTNGFELIMKKWKEGGGE